MEVAEEITFSLPPELIQELRASVAAGDYVSTSEALRDAVRLWKQRRIEDDEHLEAIRARIRRSLDDPRPNVTIEDVDAHLDALFTRAKQSGGNATP